MAITGSTRMQATSIELLAMLTVLEMVLRELLGADARLESGRGPPRRRGGGDVRRAGRRSTRRWPASACAARSPGWSRSRSGSTAAGARTSYFAHALGVDVLTDTTERSPTFCTPSFRKRGDADAAESWAFLFTPVDDTESAWPALLRRPPHTIEWTEDVLRSLLDEEAATRQAGVLREIGRAELMRFRIGLDGQQDRPIREGDGVTVVVSGADLHHLQADGAFARALVEAAGRHADGMLIAVGRADAVAAAAASAAGQAASRFVALVVPDTPFLLDPMSRDRREDAAQRALHVHDGAARPRAGQPDDLGGAEQPQADRPIDALHPRPGRRLVRGRLPEAVRGHRLHRAPPPGGTGLPAARGRRGDLPAGGHPPGGGGGPAGLGTRPGRSRPVCWQCTPR